MELIYLWVGKFRNIQDLGFHMAANCGFALPQFASNCQTTKAKIDDILKS